MYAKRWHIEVQVTEADGETSAEAVLSTGDTEVRARGEASRNPADFDIPEIGDELAVGRALIALGRALITATERDISAVEGRPVHVS